jgi:inner membrane transporter RhtA
MVSSQAGAAVAKGLFARLGAPGMAALRLVFAALVLFAVFRPWRNPPARAAWPALARYGVALGVMNMLFYLAIARVPLGVAVALEFTGPLAVALIGSRRGRDLVWAVLAGAGVFLLSPLAHSAVPIDPVGALLALGAGACWALYIVFGQKAAAAHGPAATAWGLGIAALFVFPAGLYLAGPVVLQPGLWPMAAMVAVLSSALPYTLEMIALGRLSTRLFGVLMSVEPALAALWGYLLLRERLEPLQLLGVAAVALASAGAASTSRSPVPAEPGVQA